MTTPDEPDDIYRDTYDDAIGDYWEVISDRNHLSRDEIAADVQLAAQIEAVLSENDYTPEFLDDYVSVMIRGEIDREFFFEYYDIDIAGFDWESWREAMGYN